MITHQRFEQIHAYANSQDSASNSEAILAKTYIRELEKELLSSMDRHLRDLDMCERQGWATYNGEYNEEVMHRMAHLRARTDFMERLNGRPK